MIDIILVVAAVGFFSSFLVIPRFMEFLRSSNIVGIDQQKKDKPLVPSSGGLPVAFGLLGGIMFYIALNTFLLKAPLNLTALLAASSTILIISLVGILDDINIKQIQKLARTGTKEFRLGLRQWVKPVMTLTGAVPLMVVSAGASDLVLPFIGAIDVGILFPLLFVPVAVVVVSNVNNMLAGMNGLEAGLGFVASISLGIYLFLFGRVEGGIISFALASALLAFLVYNWYPARILPGDSLTYLIGATFVTAVIVGNAEKFGIFIYIPWIIEAFLKLRGRFAVSSLGVLGNDGRLKSQYKGIYSLTHIFLRSGNYTEKQIAFYIILFEAMICLLAFLIFL
jgi:UDP-N-acetylglucosamine--dolichyl-phosphate N-acetylglucosaminephosphotransferase